jgi:hypothetical protein
MFILLLAEFVGGPFLIAWARQAPGRDWVTGTTTIVGIVLFVAIVSGLAVVNPNEARVLQFFGRYVGSLNQAGFGSNLLVVLCGDRAAQPVVNTGTLYG